MPAGHGLRGRLELARLLAAHRIRRRATGAFLLLAGYVGVFLGLVAYLLAGAVASAR